MARSKPNTSTMGVIVCSRTWWVSVTETSARVALLMAFSIVTFWLSSAFRSVSSTFSRFSSSNLWRRSDLSWSISCSAVYRVDLRVKGPDSQLPQAAERGGPGEGDLAVGASLERADVLLHLARRPAQEGGKRAVDALVVGAEVLGPRHSLPPVPAEHGPARRLVDELHDLGVVQLGVELVDPPQHDARRREDLEEDLLPVAELAVEDGLEADVRTPHPGCP